MPGIRDQALLEQAFRFATQHLGSVEQQLGVALKTLALPKAKQRKTLDGWLAAWEAAHDDDLDTFEERREAQRETLTAQREKIRTARASLAEEPDAG